MDIKTLSRFELTITHNVWELHEEATSLFRLGHYPRAYALAHLAFEENAKVTFLSFMAWDIFMGKEFSIKELEKMFASELFTDHKLKLRIAFLKLPGFDYQTTIRETRTLNILKNKSIYTDIFEGEMCKPSDFFGESQASTMLDIAGTTLQKRFEELGSGNSQNIKDLTSEIIEAYYLRMKRAFDSQIQFKSRSYVNFLKAIITNEKLFNSMKKIF